MAFDAVACEPLVALVGADLDVPVAGGTARFVNLDNAATTPALPAAADAAMAALATYGSVHRGTGHTSEVSTGAYADARATVARFTGARADDHVVFTRNTTDALNLLAAVVPAGTTVYGFAAEHHANLLPWRRGRYVSLGFPSSPEDAVERVHRAVDGPALVTVTGASNVTGELWPVADIAAAAHERGARVAVDAAQLAPHRSIDITATAVDYVAFSGHKLYAPFGAGALVGRSDWLDAAEPYLAGGGAVERVDLDDVAWSTGPARHEAGTPNLLGAVALAAACDALASIGFTTIAAHEGELLARLSAGLDALGLRALTLWGPESPRIGVAAIDLAGAPPHEVARRLAEAHGIGVRAGSFCAHPLVDHLFRDSPADGCDAGGALRVSVGAGSSSDDIDRLLAGLRALR